MVSAAIRRHAFVRGHLGPHRYVQFNRKPRRIARAGLLVMGLSARLGVADFHIGFAGTTQRAANGAKAEDHEGPCRWFRNRACDSCVG